MLMKQPDELKELNELELGLISQRMPFMKLVGLPRGRQKQIHGPAVNVPLKLDFVCKEFPRLPSESNIVPLKFKRALKYKSHYMHDFVRPHKVLDALRWLKQNNPLYKDIKINENWVEDAKSNDDELFEALTNVPDKQQNDDFENDSPNTISSSNRKGQSRSRSHGQLAECSSIDKEYHEHLAKLKELAHKKGFVVTDVPRDGNCFYNAVLVQTRKSGLYYGNASNLREDLALFMKERPVTSSGVRYREFLSDRNVNDDELNADTDNPDEEDLRIQKIKDKDERQEAMFQKLLREIATTMRFADVTVATGLAHMLQVNVNMLKLELQDYIESIKPDYVRDVGDINLGCIGQWHWVALEKENADQDLPITGESMQNETDDEDNDDTEQSAEDEVTYDRVAKISEILHEADVDDDDDDNPEQIAEDNAAFERVAKISGKPYETGFFAKDGDLQGKVLACAPGEESKPLPLLSDPQFEEMSNPDKYPYGNYGLNAEREKKIDARRYFNQRLLNIDGRFAKSIPYILAAQYATESKQVHGNINHFVVRRAKARQMQGNRITAASIKNSESLQSIVKTDQAFKLLKTVRGSPAYFQSFFYDLLAMIRQLGVPCFFMTLSAADMQWPELLQQIAKQYGTNLSDADVKNLTYEERSNYLRSNPVTAARHFEFKVHMLFSTVIMSKSKPLGEVTDYAIRTEFQARGSPHVHCLLWVKDAPKNRVNSDAEISQFVEKYVHAHVPDDDDDLKEMVLKLQKHGHSSYCRKKGQCRFGYPKPPSMHTIISDEPDPVDGNAILIKKEARDILSKVYDILRNEDTPDDISMNEILDIASVSSNTYHGALGVSHRGRSVLLKRTPQEININPYNTVILKAFEASMDIQYVVDTYALVMYIAAYITKDEKGMGELLKQVSKENNNTDLKTKLKKLGTAFLHNREVSAQEAVYRILSLPLTRKSRSTKFINTDTPAERTAIIKPMDVINSMDDDEEDIFLKNDLSRYMNRPNILNNLCLAEFVANYSVNYGTETDETSVAQPDALNNEQNAENDDNERNLPKKITLKDEFGTMHLRRREQIIRFRKFDRLKDSENYFRSRLMLYLPWRNEDRDLIANFPDYCTHYQAVKDIVLQNESKYSVNENLVDNALDDYDDHGPPQHAWEQLVGEMYHNEIQDRDQSVDVERDLENDDIIASEQLFQGRQENPCQELIQRYDVQLENNALSNEDYREMFRNLNNEQRHMVKYHRQWCKEAVIALKSNNKITPYHVFLSGPGGTGKSHCIIMIHSDTRKLLSQTNIFKPTDVLSMLCGPTGVSSFNISGQTLHSALLLRTTKSKQDGTLTADKLNTLRTRLENLTLLVIDEISMVGIDMLIDIHKRLNEIKGVCDCNTWFGNVSILAVGDLFQLPPVKQRAIYQKVSDAMARICGSGCVFKDMFKLHELHQIMRQKDDQSYAELLCRVRTGSQTKHDLQIIQSREISKTDPEYPVMAPHLFALNKDVDEHNCKMLESIATPAQQITLYAQEDKTDTTGEINISSLNSSTKRKETGGLETVLRTAKGAKVMMTINVDTSDGLVNGVMGEVIDFIRNNNGKVIIILIQFENCRVGQKARESSPYKHSHPTCVPVKRHSTQYEKAGRQATRIGRKQFPLTLSWAVTIHKMQGLTLEMLVLSMKNALKYNNGQAYVGISRVKALKKLYITDYDERAFKTNKEVEKHMDEMRNNRLPAIPLPQFSTLCKTDHITIGHLNVCYFFNKLEDLTSPNESLLYKKVDIMCFTETYIAKRRNVKRFTEMYGYKDFRLDVESAFDHGNLHGVMICASIKLNPIELPSVKIPPGLQAKVIATCIGKKKLVVAVVYRPPPMKMATFCIKMEELLLSLPQGVPRVIVGDFNEDLMVKNDTQLERLFAHHGLHQKVKQPTTDSGTCIDHVYSSIDKGVVDVVDTYYSYHDGVYYTFEKRDVFD